MSSFLCCFGVGEDTSESSGIKEQFIPVHVMEPSVQIPETRQITSPGEFLSHTEFQIIISIDGAHRKGTWRRYTQFEELDVKLREEEPRAFAVKSMTLPKKGMTLGRMDARQVEQRRTELEIYLQSLMTIATFVLNDTLGEFLDFHFSRSIDLHSSRAWRKKRKEEQSHFADLAAQPSSTYQSAQSAQSGQTSSKLSSSGFGGASQFPAYWALPLDKYKEHALEHTHPSYQLIVEHMSRSRGLNKERFHPIKILLIQNPERWGLYAATKSSIVSRGHVSKIDQVLTPLLDGTCNEYYLFHGTNAAAADRIKREGLDPRVSGAHGNMFGDGVYLADTASKADHYANKVVIFCRAVLGDAIVLRDPERELRRPPPRKQSLFKGGGDGGCYDSVVGDLENGRSRQYIVYERNMVYPEFIVYYSRE